MSMPGRLIDSLRRRVVPVSKGLLFKSGALQVVRTLRPSSHLAILRYHAVCGPEGYTYASPGICVSPSAFKEHVRYLASRYAVLALPEAVRQLRDGRRMPPNAVAITFDDGYFDNLEAARVLHHHGLSATFYMTAGCLAGEEPFWPSEVRLLVRALPGPCVVLKSAGVDLTIPCSADGERLQAMRTLSRLFKVHPIHVREQLRAELRVAAGAPTLTSPMLDWDQVREMRELGMTIGSHTLTHPNLPNAGPADAWHEIIDSKRRLEAKIGAPVTMFSYPNGGAERYMTDEIAQLVRKAGFEAATTSRNGFAGTASDLFALERVQVSERIEDLLFALEVERFVFKPKPRVHLPA